MGLTKQVVTHLTTALINNTIAELRQELINVRKRRLFDYVVVWAASGRADIFDSIVFSWHKHCNVWQIGVVREKRIAELIRRVILG